MHSSNQDHSNDNTVGQIIRITQVESVVVTWASSGILNRRLSTSGRVVCTAYLLWIGNSAVNQGDCQR